MAAAGNKGSLSYFNLFLYFFVRVQNQAVRPSLQAAKTTDTTTLFPDGSRQETSDKPALN